MNVTLDFTFQSGYIQIETLEYNEGKELRLYIPIWLYSNTNLSVNDYSTNSTLHSNLVIFKLEIAHEKYVL